MRFVTALLLLVSVLTTHAVALERAAEKALTCTQATAEAVMAPTTPSDVPVIAPSAQAAADTVEAGADVPAGACHGHGDCVFLMPQHRFETSTLVPAEAGERSDHASAHDGHLVNKPPIA
ncbi:MAG: hypothetical protein JJ920_08940 [Roseitalea sp.]|jgi:hypothetical protein|nr:hypothetical protein [Roseitalea sp.]MBO6743024.1 hypothetical protein [Roseitalea sp.]